MHAEARKMEMQAQAKALDLQRADEVDQRKTERAMQLADLQFKYDVERMRLQAEADAGKAVQAVELKRAEKQAEFDMNLRGRQLDFDFVEAAKDRESERQGVVPVRVAPVLEEMNRTIGVLGKAIKGMAAPKRLVRDAVTGEKRIQSDASDMSLEEAIKRMAAPRRLVKDPVTGEKRMEVVLTEMSLEDAINALGAPRRVVRDPITGEKRTESLN